MIKNFSPPRLQDSKLKLFPKIIPWVSKNLSFVGFEKKTTLSFLVSWSLGGGIGFLFFFFMGPVWADQQGGQRPAPYLEYGAGGAQVAMGGATAGLRNDVSCGFWNPAGLSGLRGFQIENQYTFLGLNQQLDYFSLANGFRDKFFYGVTAFYYSAGYDLETRVGPSVNPDSIFGDTEFTFISSFAVRLSPRWSVGANFKVLSQSIGGFSGFGFGEDLGVQYRFTKFTTFGFMAQDPYTVFTYANSSYQIVPITLKAGIAHHDEKMAAKINFDLEWSSDLGFRPRCGVEWRPAEVIALRGGFWAGNLTAGTSGGSLTLNFSTGFGILMPMGDSLMELDYHLLPDRLNPGGFLHQLSLVGKFL